MTVLRRIQHRILYQYQPASSYSTTGHMVPQVIQCSENWKSNMRDRIILLTVMKKSGVVYTRNKTTQPWESGISLTSLFLNHSSHHLSFRTGHLSYQPVDQSVILMTIPLMIPPSPIENDISYSSTPLPSALRNHYSLFSDLLRDMMTPKEF